MIHLHDVTKIYSDNKVVALENINIDIEKGEFVFIVGTSGSGKSTLMKLLMREELTTSGQIIVDGRMFPHLRKKKFHICGERWALSFKITDYWKIELFTKMLRLQCKLLRLRADLCKKVFLQFWI